MHPYARKSSSKSSGMPSNLDGVFSICCKVARGYKSADIEDEFKFPKSNFEMSHLPPKPDFDAKPRGDSYIPRRPDSYVDSYVAPRRGYEQRGRRRDYSPERRDYSPERHWGRRSRSRDYPREYRRDSRPDYRRSPPRPPREYKIIFLYIIIIYSC